MAKKKKKKGSIAGPFLITIFLGLLIIGGGAFGIYKYFGLGQSEELSQPKPRQVPVSTYEDNHTILFILDEPDQKCSSTFVMLRSIPKDKRMIFVGIPTNSIAVIDDHQQSLKGAYERGGASAAVKFVDSVFGIEIDRYMKINSEALLKICNILGGVTYPVNADIAGFNSDGTEQYLNAEQIETLVTYPMFDDGEIQRAYIASSIISDMINQTNGKRVADSLDTNFNLIINMTDSDITAVDYRKLKDSIKTMLERGSTIAAFLIMDGTSADNDFIPSQSFVNEFVETYFKYDE